jgi:hypothetical protein
MNLEAAILYAHQRMREIGKQPSEYHFEPVSVFPTDYENKMGFFTVSAYNEIYILIKPENYYGIFIIGDNSAYNCDDPRECGVPEFTGMIRFIQINSNWSFNPYMLSDQARYGNKGAIEFLRVVY